MPLAQEKDYKFAFSPTSNLCLNGRITKHGESPVTGGGYADVWEGTFDGRKVALKIVRTWLIKDPHKLVKRLWREHVIWSTLNHPNILPFLGFCVGDSSGLNVLTPWFVSPWMDNGTVLDYLKIHPSADRLKIVRGTDQTSRHIRILAP